MNAKQESILSLCRKILSSGGPTMDKLGAVCHLLAEEFNHYDWVGIYIADPKKKVLMLGPYAGDETEHTVIPYGKGICGQVAESQRTFLAEDVNAQENYLACSPKVKSEIVVPIMKHGRFVAQLDIDSHTLNAFTVEDKNFLESLCREMASLF